MVLSLIPIPGMNELTRAINAHVASEYQASHTSLAMAIWLREKDLAGFSQCMPDGFVAEQLQEESEARFVLKRLRLAGDNSAALLLWDQQFLEGTALAHVKGPGSLPVA